MKTEELIHVAILFCLFVFFIDYCLEKRENNKLFKQVTTTKTELFQAKTIAIQLDDENNELHKSLISLNVRLDEVNRLDRIIEDLKMIPRDMQNLTLGSCYDETNLTNNVKHPGKYDKTTVGICGVKKEWIGVIPELTEENIDSLYAGYLVLDHLIKEKGSKVKGLAAYKGSIKNYKPVHFTLKVEKELNKKDF